jgi:ribosome-binding ATPase YchF (GTP1/OBG family)
MAKQAIKELELNPEEPAMWPEAKLLALASLLRQRSKPMMIAANKVDLPGAWENYERLKREFPHYHIVPCSADFELALREASKHGVIAYVPGEKIFTIKNENILNEKQKGALGRLREFLETRRTTGVQEVLNHAVFDLLKYKPIFPGGVAKLEDSEGRVIPDCFLMPAEATALDFAFRLHTDFGKNFVKAINVRTKLPMAKEHVLAPGDIVEIMATK